MPTPHRYIAKDNTVTWKVRFRLNGRNCQETFDTKKKAEAFCSDITSRDVHYALEVLTDKTSGSGLTVAEVAERFFSWKETDTDVRSNRTVADYRRDYRNWIAPTFGTRLADTVDEVDVQQWIDDMRTGRLLPNKKKPPAPKSVADRHAILYGIYAWGMSPSSGRLLSHNPCVGTKLPKRSKKPPKGLRPAEWQALYPALHTINPDAADLALFLLASGWRISEAAALSSFDVEDNGMHVHVSMGRVVRRNKDNQYEIVEDAKSDAGLRRIKLDDDVADMVRRRRDRVPADGLIFTTAQGTQWRTSNFTNRYWNKAVEAANLSRRPTPHWLRHTSVFWLITQGANLVEIQRRIGHEHYSTTVDVYGRMVDDVAPAALEGFAAMRNGRQVTTASEQLVIEG